MAKAINPNLADLATQGDLVARDECLSAVRTAVHKQAGLAATKHNQLFRDDPVSIEHVEQCCLVMFEIPQTADSPSAVRFFRSAKLWSRITRRGWDSAVQWMHAAAFRASVHWLRHKDNRIGTQLKRAVMARTA